jgi:hypothetical protein
MAELIMSIDSMLRKLAKTFLRDHDEVRDREHIVQRPSGLTGIFDEDLRATASGARTPVARMIGCARADDPTTNSRPPRRSQPHSKSLGE